MDPSGSAPQAGVMMQVVFWHILGPWVSAEHHLKTTSCLSVLVLLLTISWWLLAGGQQTTSQRSEHLKLASWIWLLCSDGIMNAANKSAATVWSTSVRNFESVPWRMKAAPTWCWDRVTNDVDGKHVLFLNVVISICFTVIGWIDELMDDGWMNRWICYMVNTVWTSAGLWRPALLLHLA